MPSPTGTPQAPPNQPAGQSSTLYLFTFLATLLLLLAVSCAIVIRSFILRRRFRRRIEEAIAAGVLIPGALDDGPGGGMGRGRRRDFGEKPKLWEVWVDEHGHIHGGTVENGSERDSYHLGKGEGRWEEILPISATVLSSNTPKIGSVSADGSATSFPTSGRQNLRRNLFISRLFGRRSSSTPLPAPSPPHEPDASLTHTSNEYTPSLESKDSKEEERLQVSVLISMPNPNWRRTCGSEIGKTSSDISVKGKGRGPGLQDNDGEGEVEIPDVVFGVAEVGLRS